MLSRSQYEVVQRDCEVRKLSVTHFIMTSDVMVFLSVKQSL